MAGKVVPHIKKVEDLINAGKDFVVNGGAGSGKTYALVETLKYIHKTNPTASVACITYTNVAVKEIQARVPYSNLYVSTIHEFIWDIIKNYKINLITAIIDLINAEKSEHGVGIRYSGEINIDTYHPKEIKYKEYTNIEEGIISHDEVLKLGYYIFDKYPLMSRILGDRYDYIFVDEYQDTSNLVVKLLIEIFRKNSNKTVIGFFGDPMQSIYGTGIGQLRKYIDDTHQLEEVIISGNRRCSKSVINILNKIRVDITQNPANNNVKGSVRFLYSHGTTNIEELKKDSVFRKWDFSDTENTKELYLTHRLIARRQNFETLQQVYPQSEQLLGDSQDKLIKHILKLEELLYLYHNKKYNEFISKTDYKIRYHQNKIDLYEQIKELSSMNQSKIKNVVELANEHKICIADDSLKHFAEENNEIYEKVMDAPYRELRNLFNYINNKSPYSTQHGVKGAEFENVLVVLDNGNWNQYNFEQLLGTIRNQNTYDRTHKLFYVCCSRAKRNLVIYCPNFKDSMLAKTTEWFGADNIKEV